MKEQKEQKEMDGRDVGIAVLNEWFDEIETRESKRIQHNLDKDELSELVKIEDDHGKMVYDAESQLILEESDVSRERVITAIRKGILVLDDKFQFTFHMKEPIKKAKGDIIHNKLVFKTRFRSNELAAQMKGVGAKDNVAGMEAIVGTMTGVNRLLIGTMDYRDSKLCTSLAVLFSRAD